MRERLGRGAGEEANHRHRLLLRAGQERIHRRAGENRHEVPASHPQPLEQTLRMDYGSPEPLPKGWTNVPLPPDSEAPDPAGKVGCGGVRGKIQSRTPTAG